MTDNAPSGDEAEPEVAPVFPGDDPRLVLAEVKGYLKAHIGILTKTIAPPTRPDLEAVKGLVLLSRETARGDDAHPLIVANVEALRQRYLDQLRGSLAPSTPVGSRQCQNDGVFIVAGQRSRRLQFDQGLRCARAWHMGRHDRP